MKPLLLLMGFAFSPLIAQDVKYAAPPVKDLEEAWSTPPSFDVPESVLYDQKREALYVSNINGKPTEKNGKGYISKMTLGGKIRDQKWISGLHAPKGMALYNDTLFVTDIDRLILIDMKHGQIAAKYGTEKAKFLNDIAVSSDGTVYISDMRADRIYSYKNGKLNSWKKGDILEQVNGLTWQKGTLYAGTKGHIVAIEPSDRSATTIVNDIPSVDGLIGSVKGGFLFSDWKGRVFFAKPGKEAVTLSDTRDEGRHAADIAYMKKKGQVLVPTFFDNRVFAYEVVKE